jgi:bacillithiol system protein YtxJ
MGWFNSKKENSDKKRGNINWEMLTEMSQLDEIREESKTIPILILKHSTRCSVSLMAKNSLDRSWDIEEDKIKTYYLDLLKFRPISNQIVEEFNVHHQSPQILLIKNGICEYTATHSEIDARTIKQQL